MSTATAPLAPSSAWSEDIPWAALYRQYDGLLRWTAYGFRLSPSEAEDAVQDTWLQLLCHADQVREPDRLGGWLRTTMRRRCLQVVRQRAKERLSSDLTEWDQPDGQPCVEVDLMREERDVLLWRAVEELPPRQRQLIKTLFAADELTYDEIAAELSMPKGAIGPTRIRALRRLRGVLQESGVRASDLDEAPVPARCRNRSRA
jgi:RNA polymerase sigma factor (sigma-70 family)